MIRYESEAKRDWCPFAREPARMPDGTHVAVNRLPQSDGATEVSLCLASRCMAWRWATDEQCKKDDTQIDDLDVPGYCGLVGP